MSYVTPMKWFGNLFIENSKRCWTNIQKSISLLFSSQLTTWCSRLITSLVTVHSCVSLAAIPLFLFLPAYDWLGIVLSLLARLLYSFSAITTTFLQLLFLLFLVSASSSSSSSSSSFLRSVCLSLSLFLSPPESTSGLCFCVCVVEQK